MTPEIAFVLAPRQNLFFVELVAALRDELERLGVPTSEHVGPFPRARPGLVYALVPPHEYFTLMHGQVGVPEEALARTLFVCGEQPGSSFFADNVALAPKGGAVFDINRSGTRELARRGIPVEHLQLGYTPTWDRMPALEARDLDLLFMGCESVRRSQLLGSYAETLWRHRVRLLISDNSRPNWTRSSSFVEGEEKYDLLGRSKVLLNLHQHEEPYFEWLRVVQGMLAGAVVVSESSIDYAPLRPGEHFVAGRREALDLLATGLIEDDEARLAMQAAAYDFLREELPFSASVQRLATRAEELDAAPLPPESAAYWRMRPRRERQHPLFTEEVGPVSATDDINVSALRGGLKDVKLDLIDLRRHLDQRHHESMHGAPPPKVTVDRTTAGYLGAMPRVSVLVTLFDYDEYIAGALDSLAAGAYRDWELIVVDDGSTDDSLQCARRWIAGHEHLAALLARHPLNRGLPTSRNTALSFARGELCFVLDADNEILPQGLERLVEALDEDREAAFAYGAFERFQRGGTLGIMNFLPWDPWRLRRSNFVDAMALVRTAVLREMGGYTTDRGLYGWEDFELWCHMAEEGYGGRFVPEIVARYRTTGHSMLSLTNLSASHPFSVLIERYPKLMAGLEPPL